MSESGLKNSLRNVFFGFIKYIISFILPFFIRTVMIKRFGSEYTGLGSLFASILQVLNLSELGFSNAVVFSLYKPIAENETQKISALMLLYKKIYRIVGFVIAGVGCLICPFIKLFINGSYPDNINIYILFLLFLFNTAFSYIFFGYKSALLTASQRSDIESKIQIISNIVCYMLELCVLLFTHDYYLYVISMILGTVLNNIMLVIVSDRMFQLPSDINNITTEEKLKIYSDVRALFGHQLDAIIINSADNVVISAFLGLHILTVYNNYFYVINIVISLTLIIANSFSASIGKNIALYDKNKNFQEFKIFNYIFSIINMFCSCMMYVLYQDFINLWVGEKMLLPFSSVTLLVISFYIRQMRRIVLTYKTAAGKWKEDFLKPYISAGINLLLNIYLVRYIGINGVIISTIISLLLIEAPWEAKVLYNNYFGQPLHIFILENILYFLKTACTAILAKYFFDLIFVKTLVGLIGKAVFASIVISVICFILNCHDKEYINCKKYIKNRWRNGG